MKKWIKQLGKDSLIYGIGGVAARGLGFFLLPIYTRIFSTADYGLIELITVVCMLAFAVTAGGTDSSLEFYFTERAEEGQQAQARVVTSVLLWRVVWGGAVLGIVLLLAPLLNSLLQYDIPLPLLAIATTSVFLAGLTGPMLSVFRLLFKPWWYVGISLLGTVAAAVTTIVLVVGNDMGVMGALIGACVGAGMVSVLGLWGVRQYLSWQPQFRQWLPRLLRFGLPLVPTALALYVLNSCDRFFIVRFHGDDALGLYSVGAKFALIISLMVITFRQAWWPTALKAMQDPEGPLVFRTIARLYLGAGVVAVMWLSALAPYLTAWMTAPDYHAAFPIVGALSWSALLYGFYLIGCAGIWKVKKTFWAGATMSVAAVANLILNYLLVPRLGGLGAAIGTSVSFFLWNIAVLLISERLWRVGHSLTILGLQTIVGVTVCCCIHRFYQDQMSPCLPFAFTVAATLLLLPTLMTRQHWRDLLAWLKSHQ